MKLIAGAGDASAGSMQRGIGEQENQLKAYLSSMKPQTDISSLNALADSWYGGNLSKGYQTPTSGKEIMGNQMALQGAIQKAKMGLSETQLANLKDQLGARVKMKEIDATTANKLLANEQAGLAHAQTQQFKDQKQLVDNRTKWQATAGTKLDALTDFSNNLADYTAIIERNGGNPPPGSPDFRLAEAKYKQMVLPWKTTGELGALSGGDIGIVKGALGPETFTDWLVQNSVGSGGAGVLSALKDMRNATDRSFSRQADTLSKPYPMEHVYDLVKTKRDYYNQKTASGMANNQADNAPTDVMAAAAAELAKRQTAAGHH